MINYPDNQESGYTEVVKIKYCCMCNPSKLSIEEMDKINAEDKEFCPKHNGFRE